MPWGLFGPVSLKTKRGTRITFVAGFVTLPLTALSLWSLLRGAPEPRPPQAQLGARGIDLSDK